MTSLLRAGNTLYLGGSFTQVGPNLPYGVALNTSTGTPNYNYAKPNNSVRAAIPDGVGGWYIAGSFTAVGGTPRNYVAQLDATGALTTFNPNASEVITTLVLSGSTLYIGGAFTTVGGQTRNYVAAVDATTGSLVNTFDPIPSGSVSSLLLSGSTLYMGGGFSRIGAHARGYLAAVNTGTGVLLPIRLRQFTAAALGERNGLWWTSAEESGQYRFTVERSSTGVQFAPIGEVAGRGVPSAYSFDDVQPLSGTSYYRLRITNTTNGEVTYSAIVTLRKTDKPGSVKLSPVPAASFINIATVNQQLSGTYATVSNMQGVEVARLRLNASLTTLDISSWAAGVYTLRLTNGEVQRFVKQ